jgi:L-seryl-tRNA(Ser) seleniumtransferase
VWNRRGTKRTRGKNQKNPLLRAFRVDKLTYAASSYAAGTPVRQPESLPLFRMLSMAPAELMRRCRQIADRIGSARLAIDVVPVDSLVGGGTAPKATLPSCAISLRHASLSAEGLASAFRQLDPPVIGRISENSVLLDLRTVNPEFDDTIARSLNSL